MYKILILLSFLVYSCAGPRKSSCDFYHRDVYGRLIIQNKIPILVHIDSRMLPSEVTLVREAMDTWEKAVGKKLFNVVLVNEEFGYKADKVNVITKEYTMFWEFDPRALAVTRNSYKGSYIVESDIVFSDRLNPTYFQAIALHELGHMLGIKHIDDIDSVLYPYLIGDKIRLTDIDKKAVRCGYGKP